MPELFKHDIPSFQVCLRWHTPLMTHTNTGLLAYPTNCSPTPPRLPTIVCAARETNIIVGTRRHLAP